MMRSLSSTACSLSVAFVLVNFVGKANSLAARKQKVKAASGQGFGSSQKTNFIHTPDTGDESLRLVEFLTAQKAKV